MVLLASLECMSRATAFEMHMTWAFRALDIGDFVLQHLGLLEVSNHNKLHSIILPCITNVIVIGSVGAVVISDFITACRWSADCGCH